MGSGRTKAKTSSNTDPARWTGLMIVKEYQLVDALCRTRACSHSSPGRGASEIIDISTVGVLIKSVKTSPVLIALRTERLWTWNNCL